MAVLLLACRKQTLEDPCLNIVQPNGDFVFLEPVGDTSFAADTVFADNGAVFRPLAKYETETWKVGNDPREFEGPNFGLLFPEKYSETISVSFKGTAKPNSLCFPNDKGTYKATKKLTVVEQFDRATLTVSSMVGSYVGSYTDAPNDKWTVSLKYFDSANKYSPSLTGVRNFYRLFNFPRVNPNTSGEVKQYPELENSISIEMGFKSFSYSFDSEYIGKGWLIQDTLFILNGHKPRVRKFIAIKQH
ncbi:MAG: hypothetical protein EAY75_16995 [Bacteroidetes bacterium]|nr:MAG: hypothetical protein EAY75_16995 [Bacteroidota bacterium]